MASKKSPDRVGFPSAFINPFLFPARKTAAHQVNATERFDLLPCDLCYVTEVWNMRVVVLQYRARERLNF